MYHNGDNISIGDELGIGLQIINSSFLSTLKCELLIQICNAYLDESVIKRFCVPVLSRSDIAHTFTFKSTNIGLIEINLFEVHVYDMFGLCKIVIPLDSVGSYTVMPKRDNIETSDKSTVLEGVYDNENEARKGYERSDSFDIRRYVHGDRIKDIHWKISAKRDELLVKQHLQAMDRELVLFIDSSSSVKMCNDILSFSYGLIEDMLSEGTSLLVLFFDYNKKAVSNITISKTDDIFNLFVMIFEAGHGSSFDDIASLVIGSGINAKSFIRIGQVDRIVEASLYEI